MKKKAINFVLATIFRIRPPPLAVRPTARAHTHLCRSQVSKLCVCVSYKYLFITDIGHTIAIQSIRIRVHTTRVRESKWNMNWQGMCRQGRPVGTICDANELKCECVYVRFSGAICDVDQMKWLRWQLGATVNDGNRTPAEKKKRQREQESRRERDKWELVKGTALQCSPKASGTCYFCTSQPTRSPKSQLTHFRNMIA